MRIPIVFGGHQTKGLGTDGGGDFKLVNCLEDWMFRAKRIPGSIHFESLKHALDTLDPKEEVMVYCSNFGCTARHARVPTTRRPRFSEPQHYAFSQRAAIAERSPQCPGVARDLSNRCRRFILPAKPT